MIYHLWNVTITTKKHETVRVVARDEEEAEDIAVEMILDADQDAEVVGIQSMIDDPPVDDL